MKLSLSVRVAEQLGAKREAALSLESLAELPADEARERGMRLAHQSHTLSLF